MKQNKKIKKSIVTVASIISAGSLFASTSSYNVLAEPIQNLDTSKIEPIFVDPTKFESLRGILAPRTLHANKLALDKYLKDNNMFEDNYNIIQHYISLTKLKNGHIIDAEPIYSVNTVGDPKHEYKDPEIIGTTTLRNPNKEDMFMNSLSFSRALANTVTTTNTYGFKVGAEASGKIGLPLVAEGSIKLSAEFNFARQNTDTTTDTITYVVPSQSVKVPAGGTAKVTASLKMVKTTGKVKLSTLYEGKYVATTQSSSVPGSTTYTVGLGDWAKYVKASYLNTEKGLIYVEENKAKLEGAGTYEAHYGADVEITVELKDKNGKSIENYTTKITPQIIKSK